MKKLALTLIATLALTGMANAALPEDGYYLDKNGAPLTEAQQTPPRVKTAPMPPQTQAIHQAMATLPHATTTVIKLTIDDYGTPMNPVIVESSGSVILDQYAMTAVTGWIFTPAMRGDKTVTTEVAVPIRFNSMMVKTPAMPDQMPLKEKDNDIRLIRQKLNGPVYVTAYITSQGLIDGDIMLEETEELSKKEHRQLEKYIKRSIQKWTFLPATNPDGEAIPQTLTFPVNL